MNRNIKHLLIGLAGALFAAGALMAQTPTQQREEHATQRDSNEQERIQQGEKSGQLTPKEAGKLERQQGRIDKAQAKADANGHVSRKEAAHINHMQNKASQRIYRDKHNGKTTK